MSKVLPGLPDLGPLPVELSRKAAMFMSDERRAMLRRIAEVDIADFLNDDGEVDMRAVRRSGVGRVLKKIKVSRRDLPSGASMTTAEIEVHDRVQAIRADAELEAGIISIQSQSPRAMLPPAAVMEALKHSPALREGVRNLVASVEREPGVVVDV